MESKYPTLTQIQDRLAPKEVPKWIQSLSQLINLELKQMMVVEPAGAFFAPVLASSSGNYRFHSVAVAHCLPNAVVSVQLRLEST
jgi:hypothetical protein